MGKKRRTCEWMRKKGSRIKKWCKYKNTQSGCPKSCQQCSAPTTGQQCMDSPNHKKFKMGKKQRTCKWMSKKVFRIKKYCKYNKIQSGCPKSCDQQCSAPTTGQCKDSPNHKKFKMGKKQRTCKWMSKKVFRIKKWCKKKSIQSGCPKSCDQC